MSRIIMAAQLPELTGEEIGVSDWVRVDQHRIDQFAEATEDRQFIHVDPVRAAEETPFGGTIAHGFLSLSLLSAMYYQCAPNVTDMLMSVNYGFDKVRFLQPVKCGARVRGRFTVKEARKRGPAQYLVRNDVVVEIEDEAKAAMKAEWLTMVVTQPAAQG
ncbi:MAG: MaoC family dehydratase [Maricaulaceae bacterium]